MTWKPPRVSQRRCLPETAQALQVGCELLRLSIDSTYSHIAWVRSIEDNFGIDIPFPIIEDVSMKVAHAYGMIQPDASDTSAVRSTFFIDGEGMLHAMAHYPMRRCGRSSRMHAVTRPGELAGAGGAVRPSTAQGEGVSVRCRCGERIQRGRFTPGGSGARQRLPLVPSSLGTAAQATVWNASAVHFGRRPPKAFTIPRAALISNVRERTSACLERITDKSRCCSRGRCSTGSSSRTSIRATRANFSPSHPSLVCFAP